MGQTSTKDQASVRDILASIPLTADGLLSNIGEVVIIDSRDSLVQAYQILLKYHITSAPVYDSTAREYVGMLDLRDLVHFAVAAYTDYSETKEQESQPAGKISTLLSYAVSDFEHDEDEKSDVSLLEFFSKMKERQKDLPKSDKSLLLSLSRRNDFKTVKSSDSLLAVAELFAAGAHSVPVMDDSTHISNIVTQSSMIRYLRQTKEAELKKFLSQEIGDLGSAPVICVSPKDTVFKALELMDRHYISAVAIVEPNDANHQLIGNFSCSDMRGWFQDGLKKESLSQTVTDFLNNRKMVPDQKSEDTYAIKRAKGILPKKERPPKITCCKTNKLVDLIFRMDTYKVHRIYTTNPLTWGVESVICLKDLMRMLLCTPTNFEGKKPTAYVCECQSCKGRYSFQSPLTVANHLYKYGKRVSQFQPASNPAATA